MPKSNRSDKNFIKHISFREVIITKESWEGFPNKHLFNDCKLAWFTDRLANKCIDYVLEDSKLD